MLKSPYATLHSWHDKIESVESNFSILHINCRSVFYKLDEMCNILNYLPVTILTFTETWLPPNAEDSIHIPGYNFISKNFINKSRGNARGAWWRGNVC